MNAPARKPRDLDDELRAMLAATPVPRRVVEFLESLPREEAVRIVAGQAVMDVWGR